MTPAGAGLERIKKVCQFRETCGAWVPLCDENADQWWTPSTNFDCFEPLAASGEAVWVETVPMRIVG